MRARISSESCCLLMIVWALKNWLLFWSRVNVTSSPAVSWVCPLLWWLARNGTELLSEPYYLECSWGPATWCKINALCLTLSVGKKNFVCWAVSLTVSKPPKTILKAVSKFLLSKAGRLPVRYTVNHQNNCKDTLGALCFWGSNRWRKGSDCFWLEIGIDFFSTLKVLRSLDYNYKFSCLLSKLMLFTSGF